jgi:diguanylate cyclase (GGDEF)-like protein
MYDRRLLRHAQVDVLIATLRQALESDDAAEAFPSALAEFDRLGLRPWDLLPAQHGFYVYRAYGEIERCRADPDDERLAAARSAVAALGRIAERPIVAAHHRVTAAAVDLLAGDAAAALAKLDAAAELLRSVDAPYVAFEAAVVEARALRTARVPGQALRAARTAVTIAEEQGWPHRARRITAEFGLHGTVTAAGAAPVTPGRDNQRWAALRQVSLAASRVLDPARLARTALDETIRILGAERAFLILEEDAAAGLGAFVGRDAHGNELAELSGHSASLVERIRADRRAVVVTGTEDGEAFGSRSMVAYGLRSIVVAPLLLDDRLLGVVYLDSRVAKGMFTADDVETLIAITHHVAVSLETARTAQLELAVAAANQQRDLAETLRSAMTWFTGTLDPDELLGRALASVGQAGVSGEAYLLLGDPDRLEVAHRDGDGLHRTAAGVVPPPIADLLDTTAARTAGAAAPWSPAAAALLGVDAASWLVVPLVARGASLGVLLISSPRPDAYGDADVEIVAALAGQAMTAYDNARLFAQVHELATVDSLTGIANRRHFFAGAQPVVAAARRDHEPLAAVMLDIDHFKKINDTYGHQTGDEVIREVVNRIRGNCRSTDLLARYGGEEFVLLLPGTGTDAAGLAERFRADVAAFPVTTSSGPVSVSISVGLSYLDPADEIDALLARADKRLYEAKSAGRNRVVADTPAQATAH